MPALYPIWRRYLTVEPVTLFYTYGLIMSLPIWQQYVYNTASEIKNFPYKNLTQGREGGQCAGDENFGPNSTLKQQEKEVQRLAANIDLGHTLFVALPSLLVAPFWGPWTDKAGRKYGMIAPAVGAALESTIVLLIMYLKWPLWVMFIGGAINGFSGFLTTLTLAVMSFIADTTEKEGRAFRLAIMQLMIFVGGMISQVTSGLWIEKYGFIVPTYLILVCSLLSGLCTIFLVPETRKRDNNEKVRFFSLGSIKECVQVFRKPREGGQWNLVVLILCSGILTLTTVGLSGVVTLFVLKSPLCWSPTLVGYFMAFRFLIQGVGAAVGIKTFGRCLREVNVARVGMLTQIAGLTVFAFADRTWMVFLVPIVGLFNGTTGPIILGLMSRIVGPDEQGVLFSVFGIVNTLSQFIGAMMFNVVYQRTLDMTFGFVFLLSAVLVFVPMACISCIKFPPTSENIEVIEEQDTNIAEEKQEDANQNTQEQTHEDISNVNVELLSLPDNCDKI